jgi:hypothetical protein
VKITPTLADRALYGEYLHRLDARAVLEHYGAERVREEVGRDGSIELIHSCLLDRVEPHHAHGDANPSASLNVDKKLYVCYALGWGGDLMHLVQKLENRSSLADALPVISSLFDGSATSTTAFRDQLKQLLYAGRAYSLALPHYSERVLTPWLYHHPYMTDERAISIEAQALLKIGYSEADNRIVFPHFVDGHLVGWQMRSIPYRENQWPGTIPSLPKYRSNSGFPKAETLYGLDLVRRVTRGVTVVESPMSVAKAHSFGIGEVVATFGAKTSAQQAEILADFDFVRIWFDDDPAGRAGAHKLANALHLRTKVTMVEPDEGKDLADYTEANQVWAKLWTARPATLVLAETRH